MTLGNSSSEKSNNRQEEEVRNEMETDNFYYGGSFRVEDPEQEHGFPLLDEDGPILRSLGKSLRTFLQYPSLKPEMYDSIQKAVEAVERLPEITPGLYVNICLSLKGLSTDEVKFWEIYICDSFIYIMSGGVLYGDTYSERCLAIESDGYHDIDYRIWEWFADLEDASMKILGSPDSKFTWPLMAEELVWSISVVEYSDEREDEWEITQKLPQINQ